MSCRATLVTDSRGISTTQTVWKAPTVPKCDTSGSIHRTRRPCPKGSLGCVQDGTNDISTLEASPTPDALEGRPVMGMGPTSRVPVVACGEREAQRHEPISTAA